MMSVLRGLARWTAYVYLFYLAVSFLVVLPALNIMAPRLVQDTLDRELRSELLLFNPFTLTLEARRASFHERDGHQPLAFRRVRVNLSTESLYRPGVVFDVIAFEGIDLHVLRHEDGRFHIDDLITASDSDEETADSTPPLLTIHDLLVQAHTLRYTDASRPGTYTTVQQDLELRTRNLSTVPDRQGNGNLELISDGGGLLSWRGEMDLARGQSAGTLTLKNIDLTPAWRYGAAELAFVTESARFDATFQYRADWQQALQFTLQESRLHFYDLDVRPVDADALPHTRAALDNLRLEGLALDLTAQSVALEALRFDGLGLEGFDRDGELSPLQMFLGTESAVADTEAVQGSDTDETDGDEAAWNVSIATIQGRKNAITWRTDYLSPDSLRITPLELSASSIAWPATEPSPLQLSLAINGDTSVRVDGNLHIGDGSGDLALELADFPLPWINPVWNEQLRTDIQRGQLSVELRSQLAAFAPETLRADVHLESFGTSLHETGEEAFSLSGLEIANVAVDVPGQHVTVESLTLERPAGSLHIQKNGQMNINGMLREPAAEEETSDTPEDTESAWRVELATLALHNGRLDFADSSLPLPFKTLVDGIEAELRDVDTAAEKPLTADLRGTVDGYAPVLIQGRGQPFSAAPDGELRLNFRGVDIATMSPYSGTYAGYTIESGTLSLDLSYGLNGQSIDGDNRIVISQMALGEPVESDLAIDVPLKLGIALLTDSEGVIDLSVPVSGSVDDPEFSLGKVIGRAITNIIVKAVSAPFKLLAGLVGSDVDLEYVSFAPGNSALDDAARETLGPLAKALEQRPQLQLRINGGADPVDDARRLREQQLGQRLSSAGLSAESLARRDEAFALAVAALYEQTFPEAVAQAGESSDEDAASPNSNEQWLALVNREALSPSVLKDLATARAAATKRELVTVLGVDAARIAISYDDELKQASVQMSLDT